MRSKQIIITIVVVVALAGAGILAYLSLRGNADAVATPKTAAAIILPHGNSLNFDKINKFNQNGQTFQYPVTTPADTGLQLNDIISQ
ncbi:MAG TPA: hypothetical protein VHQ41_00135 [Patescibacteria group bacterium]|jgi:flagellar basal body-associated protein FliL|nr:hypothetical protein [Patescibacteria group bacterium]